MRMARTACTNRADDEASGRRSARRLPRQQATQSARINTTDRDDVKDAILRLDPHLLRFRKESMIVEEPGRRDVQRSGRRFASSIVGAGDARCKVVSLRSFPFVDSKPAPSKTPWRRNRPRASFGRSF